MQINHFKIVPEKDGYTVVVYLDPSLEEFGGELGKIPEHARELKQQIQSFIKSKFPNMNIRSAKVMVGSMIVATIALNPTLFDMKAKAATYAYNTPHQVEYVVKPGDSLSVIAKKYGTTVDAIMFTNNLPSTLIIAGQTIKIPSSTTNVDTKPTADIVDDSSAVTTYTVVSGDSLSVIAKKFNTTVNAIKRLNHLTSDIIYVGQVLKVSEKAAPTTTEPTEQKEDITATSTYIVTSGDALSLIAKRFNTTVAKIKELNNLTSDTIYVGQKLKIPGSATGSINVPTETEVQPEQSPGQDAEQTKTYTVVSGDTLYKIARRYNTTIDAIKQTNQLQSNTIYVGQKLQIPGTQEQIAEQDTTAPAAPQFNPFERINAANQNHYLISGKTEPNATVQLTITDESGEKIVKALKADTSGNFSETMSLAHLQDGLIQVTVTATDEAGNISTETIESIVKDTTIAKSVFNNLEQITSENVHRYVLSGTAEPDAMVYMILKDSNNFEMKLQATADSTGDFQIEVDTRSLADGPISFTSYTIDQAGNRSASQSLTTVKETVIPAPVIGTANPINAQNAGQYTIFGTARPNATVEVVISDGVNPPVVTEATADLNGEFSVDIDVRSLLDAELNITASQISEHGVKSAVAKATVQKDTAVPGIPDLTLSDYINLENQSNFSIKGFAEKQAEIFVKIIDQEENTIETSGKVNERGEFSLPMDVSTLQDGEITVEVYQVDRAGNLSATSKKVMTKDTSIPEQIELDALPGIYNGNESAFQISGIAEPLLQIEMVITDGDLSETYQFMTDGVGKFSQTVDMSVFKEGEISISFTGINKAGNRNELTTMSLIKDTIIENINLEKVADYINRSNQNEFVLSGLSTEEGATITVIASDGTKELTATAHVQDGKFNLPVDLSTLDDGPVTIEFSQKDLYRNERVLGTITVQKDTIVENPVISKNGFYYQGNQLIFGLNGSAEAGADVTVTFYDQHDNVIVTQSTKANQNGFYAMVFPLNQDDYTQIARTEVTQRDVAGNTSEVVAIAMDTHTITQGETLSSIAKRYNTTVDALKMINNLTGDTVQAGQSLILPITATEVVNLGYMYYGDVEDSQRFINETAASMNIVAPSYFEINPDGSLKITWALNTAFIEAMHDQGIRVVPYLSNNWDRDLGRAMLQNKELASTQIAEAIERYNLDGVNVDIENVTDEDRADYTEFVRLLREKIPDSKEVSVAVAANPNGWTEGWHGSYDNKALAEASDYLMIMAYDESFVGSDPGPVASYRWVERSIIQALKDGVQSDQIVVGIAQYGRYWKDGDRVGGYGIANWQVEELVEKYGGTVIFDEESLSPMARITIDENDPKPIVNGKTLSAGTYTIWYENEESIQYKLSLVEKYNLRGVGNWNIVQGTEGIWNNYATGLPDSVPVSNPYIPPVEKAPQGSTYSVVAGDSLSQIAKKFGTTVNEIKELNHLTSDMIFVGQTLLIPNEQVVEEAEPVEVAPEPTDEEVIVPIDEPTQPESNTVEEAPQTENAPVENTVTEATTYVVSAGDSLYRIAQKFNTTINAIIEANNLTTDTIYIGQSLTIPTDTTVESVAPASITYTVVPGDSLSLIAKRYNTSVQAIKNANHLTSDTIYVGQQLTIPSDQQESAEQSLINYTVVAGDSLSVIAKRYNTSVNEIKRINNLQSDMIRIGQVLKIPK